MKLEPAFVALGSNLDQPDAQVRSAIESLAMLPETRLARVSSLYRSAPVGFRDQPDFVNAVVQIETALAPRTLLDALLGVEDRYGRIRSVANGPRTLDLDLLLYAERIVREAGLTIPHPRMHERAFVLVPLAEIAPDALIPGLGRAAQLLTNVDRTSVTRIEPVQQ